MTLRLKGSNSGDVSLKAPATAGDNTITLPTSNGSAEQFLKNSGTAGELEFSSMVEDSSGNVGIGKTSSGNKLEIEDQGDTKVVIDARTDAANGSLASLELWSKNGSGTNNFGQIEYDGDGNFIIGSGGSGGGGVPITFRHGSTERARIDTSGRLLIGTTSELLSGDEKKLQVTHADAGAEVILGRNDTSVTSGNSLGGIKFVGNDNNGTYQQCAKIEAIADGTHGNNDKPTRLAFSVTADGASSPSERMRIDSNGITYVNTTSNPGSARLSIGENFTSRNGLSIKNTGAQGGGQYYALFYNNSEALAGSISHNASTTVAFNTSSDYRLKENITPVVDGITRLQQLRPSRFNFIADPEKTVDGFIAHEVQAVVPEAITGEKDAIDDNGDPVYQGIDQSKLMPLLTAALQEAIGKIETLETQNTAQQTQIDDLLARVTALEAA